MSRVLSHSEIASLLDCQAAHDFRYVGRLAGTALSPKTAAPILREGRAWGAAVATLHAAGAPTPALTLATAHRALVETLDQDADEQRAIGLYDPEYHQATLEHLDALLADYAQHAEPLPIARLEHEINVPIPSRNGRRRSNRYRLLALLDGVHHDDEGRHWIVEFKLRKQLSTLEQIALSRQTRWYAWAWREQTGLQPAGVIVDERLNQQPSPVKLNKDGTPSKVQSCRLDVYIDAWQELGRQPDAEIMQKLEQRNWQHRHRLVFRAGELDEVGHQLRSAAHLAHQFDTGELFPIRNPSRMRCPGCAYRDICADPGDTELVDALYTRVLAKHERKELAA